MAACVIVCELYFTVYMYIFIVFNQYIYKSVSNCTTLTLNKGIMNGVVLNKEIKLVSLFIICLYKKETLGVCYKRKA